MTKNLFEQDYQFLSQYTWDYIIGVDEAGRGPLAGPVVAAAVALSVQDYHSYAEHPFQYLNDSKQVTAKRRQNILEELDYYPRGHAFIAPSVIDSINILQATKQAWHMAVEVCLAQLPLDSSVAIMVDGNHGYTHPDMSVFTQTKGDQTYASIALASIYAKETRDAYMREQHDRYPQYQFAQHKGYGTRLHQEALRTHGLSPLHRRSFCKKFL